jgi:hypothetical protein
MEWRCTKCETLNKRTFKFCISCGAPAGQSPAQDSEAKPEASVAPQTPPKAPTKSVSETVERVVETAPERARSIADEESGWRCHKCWKLNPDDLRECDECGTARAASHRADIRDKTFGIFGVFGKWPIVILFILGIFGGIGWLYYYLNPKHGDVIEAPAGLAAEIRLSLDQVTTRQIESTEYFNCFSTRAGESVESGGYAAIVKLMPRAAKIANQVNDPNVDPERFWQIIAHRDGYNWRLTRHAIPTRESIADPCVATAK